MLGKIACAPIINFCVFWEVFIYLLHFCLFKECSVTVAPLGSFGVLGNKIHCYVLANVCTVWFLFAALSVHKSDITIEGLLQKRTKEKEGKKEKYDFVLEIESSMSYHLLSVYLLLSHISSTFYVFWASVRHPSDLALCFI